ncbi:protein PFC0760c-like [Polistes fuscatus]|uniref:protein PFC0760c-like n=1 Tax=Polistes fuscatus TaxID=30207 RepID=UPI001CA9DA22|nr:protein PFC0760c-like [Polistes fuscatus]
MQYRILAVTIWSSIIGNLEFCTADDLANKYSGHLTEVKTLDPHKQILHPSLSRRLYFENDTLYQSTTEIITFKQDQLSDRSSSSFDNVNFNHTTSKDNETNDTNIKNLAFRIPINENHHQSVPLSNTNYEMTVINNKESKITNGTNERIESNDEDELFESETNDNLPTASSFSSTSYGKFSGPIIVPDFPQLMMSENLSNDKKKKSPELEDTIGSTLVLNPLRVGVALVNDEENTFIDDDDSENNRSVKCVVSTSTVQTEVNTLDEENTTSNDESNKSCSNINNNYQQFSKQSEYQKFHGNSTNQNKAEDTVEIQKSIEIYHNAPIQEIHYPVEFSLPLSPNVENIFQKGKINEPINYENVQKEFRISGLQDVRSGNSNVYVDHFDDNIEENHSRSRQTNNLLINNADGVQRNINLPYISMGLYLSSDKRVDASSIPSQQNNNNNNNNNNNKLNNIGIPIFVLPGQSQDSSTNYEQYSTDVGNIFSFGNKHQTPNNLKSDKNGGHRYIENQYEEKSDPSQNQYHLFQRILQNNPFIETRYVVPVSSPYSIIAKKSVEKPAYSTHTAELENLDNKVFYSIEKLTDKQTTSTEQLGQIHPQISNDKQTLEKQTRLSDPYTFYIEKTGEKKVPHVIHRLIMQPYPVNIKLPYISSDKIIPDYSEKKVIKHNNKPYIIEAGKHSENVKVYSEDIDKLVLPQSRRARIFDNKDRTPKNKYIDSRQISSSSLRMQLKSSPLFLLETQQSIVPGIMRNARQSEGYPLGDIGNFRQSKVEYGFKPPMIPSIQYDEQTASKIDN